MDPSDPVQNFRIGFGSQTVTNSWIVTIQSIRSADPMYIFTVNFKVTVDLRGVFWGKQYSTLCINGKYINLYIIGELI